MHDYLILINSILIIHSEKLDSELTILKLLVLSYVSNSVNQILSNGITILLLGDKNDKPTSKALPTKK